MFHHNRPRTHHHYRERHGYSWHELHAGEVMIEPDPKRMVELLRFLANDAHTFNRLRDTIMHRAYAVLDALEHLEYIEPPTGSSYNHGHR